MEQHSHHSPGRIDMKKPVVTSQHRHYWPPLLIASGCVICFLFLSLVIMHSHHDLATPKPVTPYGRHDILSLSRQPARSDKAPPVVKVTYAENAKDMLPATQLPNFAADHREYVFTSLIERSKDSPLDLHVTSFLLSHTYLRMPEIEVRKVTKETKSAWYAAAKHAVSTHYYPSGRRKYSFEERFTCRIRHTVGSAAYIVSGEFVPNRVTTTVSSNKRVDILRCPMLLGSVQELQGFLKDDAILQLEIYQGATPLIHIEIPWRQRAVGYLTDATEETSLLDPWEGLFCKDASCQANTNSSLSSNSSSAAVTDPAPKGLTAHLCSPCMKKTLNKDNIPLVLEYVSHHLNIGFDHISISTVWHPSSPHHQHLLRLLSSYIQEGKVSITSLSDPKAGEQSAMFQLDGMTYFRFVIATIQSNLCLYMAKGVADYMMVLDLDEFLVPTLNLGKNSLDYLIRSNSANLEETAMIDAYRKMIQAPIWTGGPGWADGNKHAMCFLGINTHVVLQNKALQPVRPLLATTSSPAHSRTWLGEEFQHGPELNSSRPYISIRAAVLNTLFPVQSIYFTGTDAPGACALPWYWNGCKDKKVDICLDANGNAEPMPTLNGLDKHHTFDERVLNRDGRTINEQEAVVYHWRYFEQGVFASSQALKTKNHYHDTWFFAARQDLQQRGFGVFLELPAEDTILAKASNTEKLLTSDAEKTLFEADEGLTEQDQEDLAVLESLATSHDVVNLPRFSADLSELVMTALIERTAESYDLHLTTFFMCHYVTRLQDNINQQVFLRLHPKAMDVWNKVMYTFSRTKYNLPGKRAIPVDFKCSMRNVQEQADGTWKALDSAVTVDGRMVPSAATVDFNANYRIEILRCPLAMDSREAYMKHAGKADHSLEVEIVKNGQPLIKYRVPWLSRVTGYMAFSTDPIGKWKGFPDQHKEDKESSEAVQQEVSSSSSTAVAHVASAPVENAFTSWPDKVKDSMIYAMPSLSANPWKGFDRAVAPAKWKMDKVYMCVPGWRSSPSRQYIAHLLEFIQHHLMMGVSHIFLGVCFSWHSPLMRKLLRILKEYIEEGRLSIASHTEDNLDFRFTLVGGVVRNTPIKVFNVNMCMYYAKGMADYVAIWDVDEFFIPHGENKNLLNLIAAADTMETIPNRYPDRTNLTLAKQSYVSQRGMADGHGHPLCYIQLYSTSYYQVDSMGTHVSPEHIFFKENFMPRADMIDQLSHKKAIHPTRRSFSLNLHTGGACALPKEWTDCDLIEKYHLDEGGNLPYNNYNASNNLVHCYLHMKGLRKDFQIKHDFDEPPQVIDAHSININTEGEIYHVQFFRRGRQVSASNMHATAINHYAKFYSDKVLDALDERGFHLPLLLLNDDSYVNPDNLYSKLPALPVVKEVASAGSVAMLVLSAVLTKQHVMVVVAVDIRDVLAAGDVSSMHALPGSKHSLPAIWTAVGDGLPLSIAESKCDRVIRTVQCRIGGQMIDGALGKTDQGLSIVACPIATITANSSISVELLVSLQTNCGTTSTTSEFSALFDLPDGQVGTGMLFPSPSQEAVKTLFASKEAHGLLKHQMAFSRSSAAEGGVHLCAVGGWRGAVSRGGLPPLLEFLQHHLSVGVQHIYLPVALPWESVEMLTLVSVLRSFLQAGSLTIWSSLPHIPDNSTLPFALSSAASKALNQHICSAHAANAGAAYLASWDVNHFFIPTGAQPRSSPGSMEVTVLPMAVEDYVDNFVTLNSAHRQVWLGSIYHRPPPAVTTSTKGKLLRLDGTPPESVAVLSQGVLYAFYDVDAGQLACKTTSKQQEQEARICAFLEDIEKAGDGETSYEPQTNSTAIHSHGPNLYHSIHFPRVYQALVERNLDLYIDSINLQSVEAFPSFKAGDESFNDYRTAFENNPLNRPAPMRKTLAGQPPAFIMLPQQQQQQAPPKKRLFIQY